MGRSWSAPEAARLTGINYPVLDTWGRNRFLVPSTQEAAGSGTRRRYSFNDLVAAVVVRDTRAVNLGFAFLAPVVARIQSLKELETMPPDGLLVANATGEIYVGRIIRFTDDPSVRSAWEPWEGDENQPSLPEIQPGCPLTQIPAGGSFNVGFNLGFIVRQVQDMIAETCVPDTLEGAAAGAAEPLLLTAGRG